MSHEVVTKLVAVKGRAVGSREAGRVRVGGQTPAVIYGKNFETQVIAIDSHALRGALNGPEGINPSLMLELDGKARKVKVCQVQKNPVTHRVIHVDFQIQD